MHVVSYYTARDVLSGDLLPVSKLPDPSIEVLRWNIRPILLDRTNFRQPPNIVLDAFGVLRYMGESVAASRHLTAGHSRTSARSRRLSRSVSAETQMTRSDSLGSLNVGGLSLNDASFYSLDGNGIVAEQPLSPTQSIPPTYRSSPPSAQVYPYVWGEEEVQHDTHYSPLCHSFDTPASPYYPSPQYTPQAAPYTSQWEHSTSLDPAVLSMPRTYVRPTPVYHWQQARTQPHLVANIPHSTTAPATTTDLWYCDMPPHKHDSFESRPSCESVAEGMFGHPDNGSLLQYGSSTQANHAEDPVDMYHLDPQLFGYSRRWIF